MDGAAYLAIAAECQHLYHPAEMPLEKWDAQHDLFSPDRLAEVDKKYKAAIELEIEDRVDRGVDKKA